jgi:P-type conjugative transfer protein TrbG
MDFRCQLKRQVAPAIKTTITALVVAGLFALPISGEARNATNAPSAHASASASAPTNARHARQPRTKAQSALARPKAANRVSQARETRPRVQPVALARPIPAAAPQLIVGPAAIRAANAEALAPSRADGFINGAQVFPFEAGRVFEVWTAPLRITTISLETGETITNKASGDTERWMIGDTTSGTGATLQTHILVKPYKAGIATNMVVTTNRRVYLLSLRAAESADAFNAAVSWTHPQPLPSSSIQSANAPRAIAGPIGRTASIDGLNQNYRIRAGWRKPPWTPVSVSDDGRQTFITFPESLAATEAPPLFVVSDTGESQLVNWRKQGNVYVVDRLFQKAELRLGSTKPRIVHLERKETRS